MATARTRRTEPFDLDPRYTVLRLYENLTKTYKDEITKGFFRTMLRPVYDMFGPKFIAENLIDKPHVSVTDMEQLKGYYKEIEAYELSIVEMMEAEETCDLFK